MTQTPYAPTAISQPAQQQTAQPSYTITEDDRRRQKRIAAAWQAYEGLLDPPLKKTPEGIDPNVLSNRCAQIVNAGVDFLFGQEVEISTEDAAPDEAQTLLDTTWQRKEARIPLLQKLAMNGALAGMAFLRIVPEPDNTYRLVVVDPSTVFIRTDPQDCETVQLYCIEYCSREIQQGKPVDIYYREEISRNDPDHDGDDGDPFADTDATWTITHWSRVGDRGSWQAAGDPISWPYEFPPLFHCQNLPKPNDAWGYPDITPDLIGMNKALNLVQSCINLDEVLYGHPILYATGTGEQDIDIKPGKIIGLPLSESKIVAVPIASDVANALQFANNLRSDMDEQSGVPGVATGRLSEMPRGNVSGIALRLLFMPLMMKSEKKKCTYGSLILDASKALFVLNGMSEDIDITLTWPPMLPADDLADAQAALVESQLGVSKTSILRKLGYDPDEEADLKQQEDAQSVTAFSQGRGMPPTTPMQPGQPPQQPSPFLGGNQQPQPGQAPQQQQ